MMAEVGGMVKVRGSRMATPLAPPRPGSTPMTVPRSTPTTATPRLNGVMATEKPRKRFSSPIVSREGGSRAPSSAREELLESHGTGGVRPAWSVAEPGLQRPLGHGDEEPLVEDQEGEERRTRPAEHDRPPGVAADPPHVEAHVQGGRHVEPKPLHHDDQADGGP